MKDIKAELAELGNKYSVKDLRLKLEATKKNLTEACKLKEKLLQQKSDIADANISQQIKLLTSSELQKSQSVMFAIETQRKLENLQNEARDRRLYYDQVRNETQNSLKLL